MNNIYSTEERATERTALIICLNEDDQKDMSYGTLCCDPRYSRATILGCALSIFQQLTGINAIMFYSNLVFKGLTMTNTMITALIGIVNFVATLFGLVFLAFAGRKTLMAIFNIAMSVTLLMLSYYAFEKDSIGMVVCVLLFITFFEFSSGPIVWLYNAEIMQDKAVSIATFLNWFLSLVISIAIPLMIKVMQIGYIFLIFGCFTIIGTLVIIVFMKETRGKTQEEIDNMFANDLKDEESENDDEKEKNNLSTATGTSQKTTGGSTLKGNLN